MLRDNKELREIELKLTRHEKELKELNGLKEEILTRLLDDDPQPEDVIGKYFLCNVDLPVIEEVLDGGRIGDGYHQLLLDEFPDKGDDPDGRQGQSEKREESLSSSTAITQPGSTMQ